MLAEDAEAKYGDNRKWPGKPGAVDGCCGWWVNTIFFQRESSCQAFEWFFWGSYAKFWYWDAMLIFVLMLKILHAESILKSK